MPTPWARPGLPVVPLVGPKTRPFAPLPGFTDAKSFVAESPFGPAGPAAPARPCAPGGPAGIWPGLKADPSNECGFTFAATTAPFRSCAVPTLFAGRMTAAYPVPPSATTSATQATTSAADGRRFRLIVTPLSRQRDCRRVCLATDGTLARATAHGRQGSERETRGSAASGTTSCARGFRVRCWSRWWWCCWQPADSVDHAEVAEPSEGARDPDGARQRHEPGRVERGCEQPLHRRRPCRPPRRSRARSSRRGAMCTATGRLPARRSARRSGPTSARTSRRTGRRSRMRSPTTLHSARSRPRAAAASRRSRRLTGTAITSAACG